MSSPFTQYINKTYFDGSKCQTPANAVLARQQRIEKQKKRKVGEVDVTETTLNGPSTSSASTSTTTPASTSAPAPAPAPKKTAVWVSNLPPNATPAKIASVFSKAGVLLIGDDGEPRIKLYYDDDGNFKGEALVMYFKEGSVTLAETLLDDTELELGGGHGNMKVKVAEYERSTQKTNEDKKAKKDDGEKVEKKKLTAEEKQRMTKRIKRMQEYVPLLFQWRVADEVVK
jgi:HIV Tat-specific factor 1